MQADDQTHLDELSQRMDWIEQQRVGKRLAHIVDREADSAAHLRATKSNGRTRKRNAPFQAMAAPIAANQLSSMRSTMSARTQDTWNYERIEVLKGPASIMYGEGAIGGAINFVTKRPDRSNSVSEALLSYGSFGALRAGFGINRPIGETSAIRIDYSHQQTDGFIDRNKQKYDHLTMAFATALSRDVTLATHCGY